MSVDKPIRYRRVRAPREHGQTLIAPPLPAVAALLAENRHKLASWSGDLQGCNWAEFGSAARQELISLACNYSHAAPETAAASASALANRPPKTMLTGHQPQLYHPGVWFKNFCLSSLAARDGAVAINLLADSDTLRSAAIAVPSGSIEQPLLASVPFDATAAEVPFEERQILDDDLFASFGERAANELQPLLPNPLLRDWWPNVVAASRETRNIGECVSRARYQLEQTWGLRTLELPLSRVADTTSFRWFSLHLLMAHERFRDLYNAALAEFRDVHGLRSRSHPVPDLAVDNDWHEAPFWIWTSQAPRRRRLFVRRLPDGLEFTDRAATRFTLAAHGDQPFDTAVQQWSDQRAAGVKIRPRALLTTMYARLVLADLFLHGIGGAKYDQLTDAIIRRFFQLDPPGFQTITATLQLPIEHAVVTAADLQRAARTERELQFQPERFLAHDARPAVQQWIAEKRHHFTEPATRRERVARFHRLREINAALQPFVAHERSDAHRRREALALAARHHALLSSREFSFCLFPAIFLRQLLLELSSDDL